MHRIVIIILLLSITSCKTQTNFDSDVAFTSNLEKFENLSNLKTVLQDVEIVALGENTHGLGEVFKTKTELVKFLHQELGFNLVLFESGYGDAALAWEKQQTLSTQIHTKVFTSNFYYRSLEIEHLMEYARSQNKTLAIHGFDCQPQQDYLLQRMTEIIKPIDSVFANSVQLEMRSFNNLYQLEHNKDTINFYKQRDRFIAFLNEYDQVITKNEEKILRQGTTKNELDIIRKAHKIFKETYQEVPLGGVMGWPLSANIRDKALLETVTWFKKTNPKAKIIIWAQNSHIENASKPNYNVNWMGHGLKKIYGDKYYSIGTIVYSGKNLNYNGSFDFEHNNKQYLAYHLNQYEKKKFVLDLRNHNQDDCTAKLLTGMESNGNTAQFVAKDRFDALLFLNYSDVPQLIGK